MSNNKHFNMHELDKEVSISLLSVQYFCCWNRQLISLDAHTDWKLECVAGMQNLKMIYQWCILYKKLPAGSFCYCCCFLLHIEPGKLFSLALCFESMPPKWSSEIKHYAAENQRNPILYTCILACHDASIEYMVPALVHEL